MRRNTPGNNTRNNDPCIRDVYTVIIEGLAQAVFQRRYYTQYEKLGLESSSRIYRRGHHFITKPFRKKVSQIICSFLNSRVYGKLLIGVDDQGTVIGYNLTPSQEEYVRIELEAAFSNIEPSLSLNQYSFRFIPVCDKDSHILGSAVYGFAKVIEICVNGTTAGQSYSIRHPAIVSEVSGRQGSRTEQGNRAEQVTCADKDTNSVEVTPQKTSARQGSSTGEDIGAKHGTRVEHGTTVNQFIASDEVPEPEEVTREDSAGVEHSAPTKTNVPRNTPSSACAIL